MALARRKRRRGVVQAQRWHLPSCQVQPVMIVLLPLLLLPLQHQMISNNVVISLSSLAARERRRIWVQALQQLTLHACLKHNIKRHLGTASSGRHQQHPQATGTAAAAAVSSTNSGSSEQQQHQQQAAATAAASAASSSHRVSSWQQLRQQHLQAAAASASSSSICKQQQHLQAAVVTASAAGGSSGSSICSVSSR